MNYLKPETFLNQKHGKVLILSDLGMINEQRIVLGKCDCGTTKEFSLQRLRNGTCNSCGCIRSEKALTAGLKHGLARHPLHIVWTMIKRRCYKPKATRYDLYGGVGVKMCEDWKTNFLSFFNWAIQNGWESGLQVDRFPDSNGDYEPNNCRIATRKQNTRNRRNTIFVEYLSQKKPLAEWCDIYNLPYNNVNNRLRKGWGIERALLTSINTY